MLVVVIMWLQLSFDWYNYAFQQYYTIFIEQPKLCFLYADLNLNVLLYCSNLLMCLMILICTNAFLLHEYYLNLAWIDDEYRAFAVSKHAVVMASSDLNIFIYSQIKKNPNLPPFY